MEAAGDREERELVFQAAMVANVINTCSVPGRLKQGVTAAQLLGREKPGTGNAWWDGLPKAEQQRLTRLARAKRREQQASSASAAMRTEGEA